MKFLKNVGLQETVVAEKKRNFDKAAEGHYLDRMIFLNEQFGPKKYLPLLKAFQVFMKDNHKPNGLDELLIEAGGVIAHIATKDEKLTEDDWSKIVWGLPYEVVKQYHLDKFKKSGSAGNREDR